MSINHDLENSEPLRGELVYEKMGVHMYANEMCNGL
jgi:hypothetical protein